jgi:hypothetical protein
MPELAAFFSIGLVLSLSANLAHYFFVSQAFKRPNISILQQNLQQIGKMWSFTERTVAELSPNEGIEEAVVKDQLKSLRSVTLFGFLLTFMSWLGLAALGVYLLSVNVLAKSRMEHKIFSSMLVRQPGLSKEEVLKAMSEFESFR